MLSLLNLNENKIYFSLLLRMGAGESKKDKVVGVEEIKIEHEKFKHFVYHEQSDQLEIKMDMYS